MVFARTLEAKADLDRQFASGEVQKHTEQDLKQAGFHSDTSQKVPLLCLLRQTITTDRDRLLIGLMGNRLSPNTKCAQFFLTRKWILSSGHIPEGHISSAYMRHIRTVWGSRSKVTDSTGAVLADGFFFMQRHCNSDIHPHGRPSALKTRSK